MLIEYEHLSMPIFICLMYENIKLIRCLDSTLNELNLRLLQYELNFNKYDLSLDIR